MEITRMDESGLAAAAIGLSRAFNRDPLQNYTFPDEFERMEKSPAHFSSALRYGLLYGEVYSTPHGEGASIWLPPGGTDITPERAEAGGFTSLPEQIGEEAFERFFSVLSFGEQFHKQDVPEPHWYTMVVGVDPAFQGQGLGRALLEPVMEKARTEGVPVYLETAQPKNVSFYKKIGFNVLRELNEPTSGLDLWTFRLDP
jgi:GNAT superfamily N-acetyltransferase